MPRQTAAAAAAHRLAREVARLIENLADAEEAQYPVRRTRAALAAYYRTQRPTIATTGKE